jgi:hypothetical protein
MVRYSDNVKSYDGVLTESMRLMRVLQKVLAEKNQNTKQGLEYDQVISRLTSGIARLQRQGK